MLVAINKIRESEPQVDYIILPKQAVSLIYLPSKDLHQLKNLFKKMEELSAGYESRANRYRPFFFFCYNCDHAAIFLQYVVSKTRMFFSLKNLKYKQNQSVLYSESLISSKRNLLAIEFSFNFCPSHFKDFIKQQV